VDFRALTNPPEHYQVVCVFWCVLCVDKLIHSSPNCAFSTLSISFFFSLFSVINFFERTRIFTESHFELFNCNYVEDNPYSRRLVRGLDSRPYVRTSATFQGSAINMALQTPEENSYHCQGLQGCIGIFDHPPLLEHRLSPRYFLPAPLPFQLRYLTQTQVLFPANSPTKRCVSPLARPH